MELRSECKILVNFNRTNRCSACKNKWKVDIKMYPQIEYDGVNWIQLAQNNILSTKYYFVCNDKILSRATYDSRFSQG
jgi:hypothetical protein